MLEKCSTTKRDTKQEKKNQHTNNVASASCTNMHTHIIKAIPARYKFVFSSRNFILLATVFACFSIASYRFHLDVLCFLFLSFFFFRCVYVCVCLCLPHLIHSVCKAHLSHFFFSLEISSLCVCMICGIGSFRLVCDNFWHSISWCLKRTVEISIVCIIIFIRVLALCDSCGTHSRQNLHSDAN